MGLLRRHDLFLDLSQPIFAKEDLRTNEERLRSEGAALHRPPGVLQEPVLDLRGLDQREEALAVQPRLLERRPQHIRVVQFLGVSPHVSELRNGPPGSGTLTHDHSRALNRGDLRGRKWGRAASTEPGSTKPAPFLRRTPSALFRPHSVRMARLASSN